MSSISKRDHCAERPSLVLLSASQEYLMTFKLMASQVVQRARPLITHICVVSIQRVNIAKELIIEDMSHFPNTVRHCMDLNTRVFFPQHYFCTELLVSLSRVGKLTILDKFSLTNFMHVKIPVFWGVATI